MGLAPFAAAVGIALLSGLAPGCDGSAVDALDARVVWFDDDGVDDRPAEPPLGAIADDAGLAAFTARYGDGDPEVTGAAAEALARGDVLVGGVVSTGCFPAKGARLVVVDGDVRPVAVGVPEDDDVECVRAVRSVALLAVNPRALPVGATVQGR